MLASLWIAYLVYGLFFDYHVATHDYYHLPLITIVAVSLAPTAELLWERAASSLRDPWRYLILTALFVFLALAGAWQTRATLAAVDYRPQAAMWSEIGERLNHGPNVVALTQDYGSRLAYWGWQNAIIWPSSGDVEYRQVRGGQVDFDEQFQKLTSGNTYFLVTDFEELQRQPELQSRLTRLPVFAEGQGYVIYELGASTE